MTTYKIIRFYSPAEKAKGKMNYTVRIGLSLEEAKAHCNNPNTRCAGRWFDGYIEE